MSKTRVSARLQQSQAPAAPKPVVASRPLSNETQEWSSYDSNPWASQRTPGFDGQAPYRPFGNPSAYWRGDGWSAVDASRATQPKVAHRFADTRVVQSSAPRVPVEVIQRRIAAFGAKANSALPQDGGGKAMPEDVQAKMEGAFGTDFSAVRIHEGPQASALGALAYTQGTEIHFAPGRYDPGSPRGQELLGHELTHVVQQSQGRVSAMTQAKGMDVNDDPGLEREADEMGAKAAWGVTLGQEGDRSDGLSRLSPMADTPQHALLAAGTLQLNTADDNPAPHTKGAFPAGAQNTLGGRADDSAGWRPVDRADILSGPTWSSPSKVQRFAPSPTLLVQQRAGVRLKGGVGRTGDPYERHANAVADAVVAGRSAEGLLDQGASTSGSATGAVQRFESNEHKLMGDKGSLTDQGKTRTVEVAPGYCLTFGDITAMAGDFFASVEEISALARHPGTREEVEYVCVVKIHGEEKQEGKFSKPARDAVMSRYYKLAGKNASHFTEPHGHRERSSLNNEGNYHDNHDKAVREAARAGAEGTVAARAKRFNKALLMEGFASHFLTDAFAAGHVRTERISISEWWNPRVPLFWENLKLFIAEEMAKYINDKTPLAGSAKTVQQLWKQVRDTIEQKELPKLTFGDLVSGAVHDYDNVKGVVTQQHGRLLGDGQILDRNGDLMPQTAAEHTRRMAVQAVCDSLKEVERAQDQGGRRTPDQVVAALLQNGKYKAERNWPRALDESRQPVPKPPWQQNDWDKLQANATMQEAIKIFARGTAASLEEAMTFEDVKVMGRTVVSGKLQGKGFSERITDRLKDDPIKLLEDIINYTPDTGGGVGGHDTDDNAMEYVKMADNAWALSTLTQEQRVKLIRNLIDGACVGEEEQAVIDLLETTSPDEMTAIVIKLGVGDAAKGVKYLQSGVDDKWESLKKVLLRSKKLRATSQIQIGVDKLKHPHRKPQTGVTPRLNPRHPHRG